MNPYLLVGALLAVGGAFVLGMDIGDDRAVARQAKQEALIREVSLAGQVAAAAEIAKIEIQQTTIRQKVEREIIKEPVYVDCRHGDVALRLLNSALENERAGPAGDRVVPETDAPAR